MVPTAFSMSNTLSLFPPAPGRREAFRPTFEPFINSKYTEYRLLEFGLRSLVLRVQTPKEGRTENRGHSFCDWNSN
ncbi:hypothetical protein EYF80_027151 [Liparis tanakae]|uniref:Uncharacterized protein n=1 Tax=Liparis tanakae TaxID=230148 RepID=A0A4Z2HC93_9TELE|nr:hypothetical protein EYF80_027151 [Liparis tanakae]